MRQKVENNRMICPVCDRPIDDLMAYETLCVGSIKCSYHTDCYHSTIVPRIKIFWDKITGPQDEFERWLQE